MADRLVLGFDGGCASCSELAKNIEEVVGERLEVQSLHDPQVHRWLREALGEEAAWAPTLIEVSGEEVRAWTGMRMGVRLSRALGPVATWRVMQVLGDLGEEPGRVRHRAYSAISRGRFLRGLGGAVVGMGMLSGFGVFAVPAGAREGAAPVAPAKVENRGNSSRHRNEALRDHIEFQRTVAAMEEHMWITDCGTLALDERALRSSSDAAISSGGSSEVYRELKRALKQTNALIKSGELEAVELFPSHSALVTRGWEDRSQGSLSRKQASCRGRSGRSFRWWGVRIWLNSCQANDLAYRLSIGTTGAALCSATIIPCRVAGVIAGLQAATINRAIGNSRNGGIIIDKSWGLKPPRIYGQ